MDTNINRVYVNPNFNRVYSRETHNSDHIHTNNHLYINPNFTKNITNVQHSSNLNRKIYVNPNFIKTSNVLDRNDFTENALHFKYSIKTVENSNSSSNTLCINEKPTISENILPRPSKPKYRLVRRNDKNILESKNQIMESCTIKINKYKSIPLYNFKKNLQFVKTDIAKPILSKSITCTSIPPYATRNHFNLVRCNLKPQNNTSFKLIQKSPKIKRNIDLKSPFKLKVLNGARKKNNMPCRLFTKYGKCLRNLYGTCEYLHDKKHVSLCRKFIKGICHDKQCLLSHELSSKKMPTCFFYLRGMCTKDECPYLHVKLSEKSKICTDFLKGYCDKGDTCPHRHVQPQPQPTHKTDKKHFTLNKLTCRNVKVNSKSKCNHEISKLQGSEKIKKNLENHNNEQNIDDGDCRYFKDLKNKEPTCEVLKPTRCKLGTLPSFIHL